MIWKKDAPAPEQATPTSPNPPSAPEPQAARPAARPADLTRIGETMRIRGQVTSREDIQMDGELDGQLESQNLFRVGGKGKVTAGVKAREVDIAGTVQGNIDAAERIVLRKGAHLIGDVRTTGIVIEDGAYFKGGIDIARPGPA